MFQGRFRIAAQDAVMSAPRRMAAVSLVIATPLLSACGGAAAMNARATTAMNVPATTAVGAKRQPTATHAVAVRRRLSRIDRIAAQAKRDYAAEVAGVHTHTVLRAVASDRLLLGLLAAHKLAAAQSYVAVKYPHTWYHWHVSRMRVTQGAHVVTEVGVPYVVPPSSMALHRQGRSVGRLYVSMQDEIGFVRLEHRRWPYVQVVIRGNNPTLLRTSMYAAASVNLPASGTIQIAGTRYQVRSFKEQSWEDGPVTIWLLMRG